MRIFIKLFISLAFCILNVFLISKETITIFSGKAYNNKKEHIFTEEYTIIRDGDKVTQVNTIFKDPKGLTIAEMASDFSLHDFLPKIHFEKLDEFSYGASLIESSLQVFRTTQKKILKSKKLNIKDGMVAGPGFYFYVLDNLEKLISGKSMKMTLVQPNRLSSYTFTMKLSDYDKETDHATINMSVDNKLIKAFVPDIELVLNAKEKSLVSYKGLSGFLSDGTTMRKVKIDYSAPEDQIKGLLRARE
ncbi:hypothetical protein COB11_06445 [Candidatus Aerophobetes bacterium]|uniref:DUF3108 domain-containing protein n=1 Tax=Aerophobetes bacterium TaxID=2030807 RepID=A0A2A4YDB9_UNCAE|nr:MAG: hypothetical protein COB11_06445 [Candidatus Aerophobetes bacterium]